MSNLKVFSEKGEEFLENKMCIDIKDLNEKILTDAPEEISFFKDMIDSYLEVNFFTTEDILKDSKKSKENETKFESNLKYEDSISKLKAFPNAIKIYEELYHALRSYTKGSLKELWYQREASGWYPKVIINRNFGTRDEINALDNEVTIYRGTSEEEFKSKNFGQAWSIDQNIAHEFAFTYYKKFPKYLNTNRIIIQAKIKKEDIFHYRNTHSEKEVIINQNKLIEDSIEIIKQNKLLPEN